MNKILVLYKSKYGATKKYTEMLKNELPCDVYNVADYKKIQLENYTCIIFAGAIYASGISGLNILRKNYKQLQKKQIVIFCVGVSPFNKNAFEEIKIHNLKDDLKDIPIFYGRGAWSERKMTLKDRTLCKMLQKMVSKKSPDSYEPWEQALMCAVGKECDWTDKKYLYPLLDYIKTFA